MELVSLPGAAQSTRSSYISQKGNLEKILYILGNGSPPKNSQISGGNFPSLKSKKTHS